MPSIDQNLDVWTNYDWPQQGDEWSSRWGGTEVLWWGSLYPRIHTFLPTSTVLEIAPGFGRFTHYLKDVCDRLVAVDIAERCVAHCKERFADSPSLEFHVNDGKSLAMIEDNSIDFVFSFDSLVHAEADVLRAYLHQLSRKLRPDGVGFIHHSNLGVLSNPLTKRIPVVREVIRRGWRAETMTAKLFRKYCAEAGLKCVGQELINWDWEVKHAPPIPRDCFSLFTKSHSRWDRVPVFKWNLRFMSEARYFAKISNLYSPSTFNSRAKEGV